MMTSYLAKRDTSFITDVYGIIKMTIHCHRVTLQYTKLTLTLLRLYSLLINIYFILLNAVLYGQTHRTVQQNSYPTTTPPEIQQIR